MPDAGGRGRVAIPLLAVLAAAVLSACGTRVISVYETAVRSPRYNRTLESLTRTKEVHDGLETRFILSATWLSPEWATAFAEDYANIYYLDPARAGRVATSWKEESGRHTRFFLALFIPDEKGNDLERPETLWSLRLVRSDEVDFQPVYVRKASMRPEEIARFFPYSGTWYRAYEVAFPKEASAMPGRSSAQPRMRLVLSGVQGRAVLVWEQEPVRE